MKVQLDKSQLEGAAISCSGSVDEGPTKNSEPMFI